MPNNSTKTKQRYAAIYPKIANLHIPTPSEIAAAKLCYPPTPPHRILSSNGIFFDSEGDVCMTDNK